MAKQSSISMDLKKLQALREGLKMKVAIQVGVFQGKSARKDGPLSNADLASIHEYGSPEHGLPARSMLKIPIAEHAQQIMAPFKGKGEEFLAKEKLIKMYKLIGVAAENIVRQAFATGGFGKWAPLTYRTLMAKLSGSLKTRKGKIAKISKGQIGQGILIDSGQLRRAFSSRVKVLSS